MSLYEKADVLVFFCNGKKIVDHHAQPEVTILTYLRAKLLLTGSKLACGEGGCGACTIMVSQYSPQNGSISHHAVNACLIPICSVHGMAITTVEGIGSIKTRLHPVQVGIDFILSELEWRTNVPVNFNSLPIFQSIGKTE